VHITRLHLFRKGFCVINPYNAEFSNGLFHFLWNSQFTLTVKGCLPKICWSIANSADPFQRAPSGALWNGSTLFAKDRYIRVQHSKGYSRGFVCWINLLLLIHWPLKFLCPHHWKWGGIKCCPCPSVRPCVRPSVRPSVREFGFRSISFEGMVRFQLNFTYWSIFIKYRSSSKLDEIWPLQPELWAFLDWIWLKIEVSAQYLLKGCYDFS